MSGRGTAAGIEFQGIVGAVFASFMLADTTCSILEPSLPGAPLKIQFEVPTSVDDVKIQTFNGQLLIQAKSAIALSDPGKGDLYSAIQQFVQQYIDGIVDAGVRRDLDKNYDRLILAVPDKAPETVKSGLKEVLDRVRTGAATGLSEVMQEKLNKFENHIKIAWRKIKGGEISSADLERIVGLSSVVTIGTAQIGNAKLALDGVVSKSGTEDALFQHLQTWAVSASAAGTGGDVSNLRRHLASDIAPFFDPILQRILDPCDVMTAYGHCGHKHHELCLAIASMNPLPLAPHFLI